MIFSGKGILVTVLLCAILILGAIALPGCDKTGGLIDPNDNTGNGNKSSPPTVTAPSTIFISSGDYSVSGLGSSWLQGFTINASTRFVLRFAPKFAAQAAIITPDQVNNFKSNSSFSGYGLLDRQVGTVYVTLAAGTYYVAARNFTSSDNAWSIELDYNTSLPSSDRCTFADIYAQGSQNYPNGGKLWQPFSVQSGFRYFLDGSSIGFKTRIISADQLNAFTSGQAYYSFSDYDETTGGAPGLYEIKLPPGDYYLACIGTGPSSVTYTMERWKVN